jgi:hypothetical protein
MSFGQQKLTGPANVLDYAVIVVVALCLIVFVLARAGHAGVDKVIRGTQKIDIDIYFTGVKTRDLDLFKVGEPAALTIRNQPVYPPMTVVSVQHQPKQIAFLSPDGRKAVAFADPSSPIASDFEVVVSDTAEVTNDGYVVRGNKLKVGNQVELEGFKYRIQGVVVDLRPSQTSTH